MAAHTVNQDKERLGSLGVPGERPVLPGASGACRGRAKTRKVEVYMSELAIFTTLSEKSMPKFWSSTPAEAFQD